MGVFLRNLIAEIRNVWWTAIRAFHFAAGGVRMSSRESAIPFGDRIDVIQLSK